MAKMITPSEDADTILRGVTKRSVVEIAASWGIPVEERKVTVEEVVKLHVQVNFRMLLGQGQRQRLLILPRLVIETKSLHCLDWKQERFPIRSKNTLTI
jgi:hypothetical protein